MQRVIILHPYNDHLAWSGAQWVLHRDGIGTGIQVSNYTSEDEARAAIKEWQDNERPGW